MTETVYSHTDDVLCTLVHVKHHGIVH